MKRIHAIRKERNRNTLKRLHKGALPNKLTAKKYWEPTIITGWHKWVGTALKLYIYRQNSGQ
jgi:hypothetical protein